MEYVYVNASSLISNNLSKNTNLVVDFAIKKLGCSVKKTEELTAVELEIIDQLKNINPNFALVQRDLNYDLLNIALQNLLEQADDAYENSKPKKKSSKQVDDEDE